VTRWLGSRVVDVVLCAYALGVRDMEKDPRRAGGGRVAWGRKPNNDLYVLDPEADPDWSPTSDERWDECYPYAGQPPRLPDDYDRSHR
jgi:hypothetical protein